MGGPFIMAKQKKPVHRVQMTEGKRNIIHQLLEEYDIHGNTIFITKSLVRGNNNSFVLKGPKKESSYRRVEYPDFVIKKFKGIKGKLVKMYPEDISKHFGQILKNAGDTSFSIS